MCLQCLTNPLFFGEVLPGWSLFRARREAPGEMEVGDWGLVRMDDPDIIFKTMPMLDPLEGLDTEDYNEDIKQLVREYEDRVERFYFETFCPMRIGYLLIEAAKKVGFDEEGDLFFHAWLFDHIAKHIEKTEPFIERDPYPESDNERKHDYSLGKY
jgi:hypothetical protein